MAVTHSLEGKWKRDGKATEPGKPVWDEFELNIIAREGAKLANTLIVVDNEDHFIATLKVLFMGFDAQCPKDGSWKTLPRNDMKKGKCEARYLKTDEGYPAIEYVWPDPVAGSCMDVFELSEDGQVLTVNSTYKREATQKVIKHKQVFNKVK